MKIFLTQYKEYFIIVIFLMLIAGLGYFVIFPLASKVNMMSNQIQEQNAMQESREKRLAELPKLQDQFTFVEKEEGKIGSVLTSDEAVDLIQEIEKIAADTQNQVIITANENTQKALPVQMKASSTKKPGEESLIQKLPDSSFIVMTVELTGTYNSLENFMKKMENVEYYCDIISFSVKIQEKSYSESSNPFDQSNTSPGENKEKVSEPTLLNSSLDIAFYIKEQQ